MDFSLERIQYSLAFKNSIRCLLGLGRQLINRKFNLLVPVPGTVDVLHDHEV
jgi:hypothetical protein